MKIKRERDSIWKEGKRELKKKDVVTAKTISRAYCPPGVPIRPEAVDELPN